MWIFSRISMIKILFLDSTDQNIITIVYGTDFTNINFLSLLAAKVCTLGSWVESEVAVNFRIFTVAFLLLLAFAGALTL